VLVAARADAVEVIRERLAWPLEVASDCAELAPPTPDELTTLRTWDPHGLFLRP
jgi:hypothetical protein